MFRSKLLQAALVISGLALVAAGPSGSAQAKAFHTLYTFKGTRDGASPPGGLVLDKGGNLYGVAAGGGANSEGVVFQHAPDGRETVLYTFCPKFDCTTGARPEAGLMIDKSGNLFGTASSGGAYGFGTVFEITAKGAAKSLYSFADNSDGDNPYSRLIQDSSGNLYGTTVFGGTSGDGVVFKLATEGTESALYSFQGFPLDGAYPYAGVVSDSDGNLYGTTEYGGDFNSCGSMGCGTVFKISTSGTETILHVFEFNDGAQPIATLLRDKSGNLYGTAEEGGAHGYGVVFEIASDGSEKALYNFSGGADGDTPQASLLSDDSGNLYGTTYGGGTYGYGVVFRLAPDGTESVLYSFGAKASIGTDPEGLITDKSGTLYGLTYRGGSHNVGTIFELKK